MTRVKVEFFKETGKWYTSFEFYSEFRPYQFDSIKAEVLSKPEFIKHMNFTIEVDLADGGWNKYLFIVDTKH